MRASSWGARHSGPSEALLISGKVAGREPASVICTLDAECRSFILWSELHCAGRMFVLVLGGRYVL